MVAVKVRQENRVQPEGMDAAFDESGLRALPAIYQIKLLMHVECMSRVVSLYRRPCRTVAEYGHFESHGTIVCGSRPVTGMFAPNPVRPPDTFESSFIQPFLSPLRFFEACLEFGQSGDVTERRLLYRSVYLLDIGFGSVG